MSAEEHLSPTQFWHLTPKTNRSSIEAHGLRAELTDEGEKSSSGLWLYGERPDNQNGIRATHDLWKVHPTGPLVHGSKESGEWDEDDSVWVTHKDVPADHVTRETD